MSTSSASDRFRRLSQLLQIPYDPDWHDLLSRQHFMAWKGIAEAMAIAKEEDAREVAELLTQLASAQDDALVLAHAHWIAANMYFYLSDIHRADQAFSVAHDLFRQEGDALNSARMSIGWVSILCELSDYAKAITIANTAEAALVQSSSSEDAGRLARLYGNVGIVYEDTGWFHQALNYYERRWLAYRNFDSNDPTAAAEAAMAQNSIGVAQGKLGQYFDAAAAFDLALDILSQYSEQRLVWSDMTLVLMNKAWLATLRNSPLSTVRNAFQAARTSRARLDQESALRDFALIDLFEIDWLIHQGQWQMVDAHVLAELRGSVHMVGMTDEQFYADLLIGQLAFCQRQWQAANHCFTTLCHDAQATNPELVHSAYLWHGRTLHVQEKFVEASAAFEKALRQIEMTRQRLNADSYRAGYLEDKLVAYQELAALHLEIGNPQAALLVSERAKARTLAEMLAAQAPSPLAPQNQSGAEVNLIAAVKGTFAPHTLAIDFVVLQNEVWTFLIGQQGLLTEPIFVGPAPTQRKLQSGLRKVQRALHQPLVGNQPQPVELQSAQAVLASWYDSYLAPIQSWLDRYEHLVIVPDQLLNALPFACLFNRNWGSYLIESHTVIIAPSLDVWRLLFLNQPTDNRQRNIQLNVTPYEQLLVLGNSAKNGIRGVLPHTNQEATMVADLFNTVPWLEEQATTQRFIELAPTADFIYIAAHGEYRIGAVGSSFIELSDDLLYVEKILQLKLCKQPIVILNACETSKGYLSGNEMMGLVRAFLYAGARAVVANHWPVQDQATFTLMSHFIQNICHGQAIAVALRNAQRTMIQQEQSAFAHPVYWGGMATFGSESTHFVSSVNHLIP